MSSPTIDRTTRCFFDPKRKAVALGQPYGMKVWYRVCRKCMDDQTNLAPWVYAKLGKRGAAIIEGSHDKS